MQAVDNKKARLNCIAHLLGEMLYHEVERAPIELPQRVRHEDYYRRAVSAGMIVPEIY